MHELSVVIPVSNEEHMLEEQCNNILHAMREEMPSLRYELLLVENGSTDATLSVAHAIAAEHEEVRVLYLPLRAYGAALCKGILESTGNFVVIFNIDFWDIDFLKAAIGKTNDGLPVVIGSKTMQGAVDTRPFLRRITTRVFNILLRFIFGYRGTDTHGIKMMRRSVIEPYVRACRTMREVFDTELLLRLQKADVRMCEIPVRCSERRARSCFTILLRVPRTIADLAMLRRILP